jgi:CheY-like chemotaxis protein
MSDIAPATAPGRRAYPAVILIVEDDVLVRLVIAEHLRAEGFEVIEANNGREAMDVIDSQVAVDLVFTDCNMPGGLEGRSLLAWLKRERPGLPVILTSGTLPAEAGETVSPGQFIAKPYQVRDVARCIRALLKPAYPGI